MRNFYGFGGMSSMDSFFFGGGFQILFFLIFTLVIGMFIVTAVRGIGQWRKNNNAPRLTVDATVVSKRTDVTRHHHHDPTGFDHTSSSTWYYATFQVASVDRMEFSLSGQEYGLLAEGDMGQLTFQGTRYLGFEPQ